VGAAGTDVEADALGDHGAGDPRRSVLVAALLFAAVVLPLVVLAAIDPEPHSVDVRSLNALLAAVCAVVAVAAGCTGVVRWRLVGDPASVRVGVALVVLGLSFACTDVLGFVVPGIGRHDAVGVLGTALTLTVRCLLVFAVIAGTMPTRMTLRARLVGAFAAVALFCALVPLVPALESFRRTSGGSLSGTSDWLARAIVIAVWAVLTVSSFVRWQRHGTRLFAWIGLMSAALAFGATVRAFSTSAGDLWITITTVSTTAAALVALYGMSQELKHAYVSQRARLFEANVTAAARAARLRAEVAERAERAHQARSAVLALQGATRLLHDNYAGRDDPMDRALRDAIEAEVELLRRLVDDQPSSEPQVFDLERVVRQVSGAQRFLGLEVTCSIEPGLQVIGRASETAEVVQSVLDNARRHADGSPVEISAAVGAGHVDVRMEDRGPGIDRQWCEELFERSASSGDHGGEGLGLYVARRLMRAQRGDLRAEHRLGGGATFVLTLPSAAESVEHQQQTSPEVLARPGADEPLPQESAQ
jgi:signal transduction histidine kinase